MTKYKEALDNIIDAYYMRGLKKINFTPTLKQMYDMLAEHEKQNELTRQRRKLTKQKRGDL